VLGIYGIWFVLETEMTEIYNFRGFTIDPFTLGQIRNYVEHGTSVGDFLTAVLENDLSEAVGRADDSNLGNLPAFVGYLYNEAPAACHGSKAKVQAWYAKFLATT